jgi:hypothetical protein
VDPVLLYLILGVLALGVIYFLFLRSSVMWGFLCIIGVIVACVLLVTRDGVDNLQLPWS